jgi:hypothetical protein
MLAQRGSAGVELEIMASPGRGDTDDADSCDTRLLITMVQES